MDLYFKKLLIFMRPQEGEYFDLTKIELALGFISDSFFSYFISFCVYLC